MRHVLTFLIFFFPLTMLHAQLIHVGTYSVRESEGIYTLRFDPKTGKLTPIASMRNEKSPSFVALGNKGRALYSVNEADGAGTTRAGAISAYQRDPKTGALVYLNEKSSAGRAPCHISIDKTGRWAIVSNYGSGNWLVYSIQPDGSLGELTDSLTFSGKGPNAGRQEAPHVHSATISDDNRFVYIADLGTDQLHCYNFDAQTGKLTPNAVPVIRVKAGAGPRHFAIHPNGRFAYLAEELISSVAVMSRDPKTGSLTLLQDAVSSLPADFTGDNTHADIHTDPSGRHLYVSNRGHNSLSIFAIAADGSIKLVGHQLVQGAKPRNFMVHPSGQFVLVANQDTDNIVVFRRDPQTGMLTDTGERAKVPSPVCLKME
ncbi:MAG: lactonase family protein [Cytophagales bacterium]|nr:MAG: lactonase family protein [Cytophagales bacterium]